MAAVPSSDLPTQPLPMQQSSSNPTTVPLPVYSLIPEGFRGRTVPVSTVIYSLVQHSYSRLVSLAQRHYVCYKRVFIFI